MTNGKIGDGCITFRFKRLWNTIFILISYIKNTNDAYTCTVLVKRLNKRKLKDGQYNEQYKTGNEKTAVHMTIHYKAKDAATQTKLPLTVFLNFNSTLDICLKFIFIEMLIMLLHTECLGTVLCTTYCLLR